MFTLSERSKRFWLVLILSGIVAISTFTVAYLVKPVATRRYVLQHPRDLLFMQRELQPFSQFSKIDWQSIQSDQTVTIPTNQGLRLSADIYQPKKSGATPVVVLLHGSSPYGRKAGLVRKLARQLTLENWLVIAPDARGFGDSQDPSDIDDHNQWRTKDDAEALLSYATSIGKMKKPSVMVIGHSLGAGHALESWAGDNRISAMVLIGPPRYINGVVTNRWKRLRFSADRELRKIIAEQTMLQRITATSIEWHVQKNLPALNRQPILLIDGGLEKAKERKYLSNIAGRIGPNLTYQTLTGVGHYCGVYNLFGASTVLFREDLFAQFYGKLIHFLVENTNHDF